MRRKVWWFAEEVDASMRLRNDGGFDEPFVPDTHPTGRGGYSVLLPEDYPDGNGANLTQSAPGKLTDDFRGRVLFSVRGSVIPEDEAVFALDQKKMVSVSDFKIAPRDFAGNMCGTRVPGVPALTGAADPTTVLSWAYDLYADEHKKLIRDAWKLQGLYDALLSWPDSRGFGLSAEDFGRTCRALRFDFFRPCVMLLSKVHDMPGTAERSISEKPRITKVSSWDETWSAPDLRLGPGGRLTMDDLPFLQSRIAPVLPYLVRNAPRICVAWEASLWLMPDLHQALVDWLAPQVTPWGGKLYVHFQQGYPAWPGYTPDGGEISFGEYWSWQVGKLTGLLHQKMLAWSEEEYQGRLDDILQRFAGRIPCPADSGFGHPFDCIALEITAEWQYQGRCNEQEGNRWAKVACDTPAVESIVPGFGPVRVMGSGNGQPRFP
jgi:hypothetical protein